MASDKEQPNDKTAALSADTEDEESNLHERRRAYFETLICEIARARPGTLFIFHSPKGT